MEYKRLNILDKRTQNRGANPFVDDYVGFTWNNIHSSSHNCFIENTGHLDFVGAPDFSNNFISPAFQTRTYYTGMQNGSKKFSLNLVFYQLTLPELNAALHWLDRTIVSDLYFDYEPYWKYSCKLSSIGTIEKYVTGRTIYRGRPMDLYLCRVPVTFETVYHPEAISAYTVYKYSDSGGVNDLQYEYSSTGGAEYMPFTTYLLDANDPTTIRSGKMLSPFMMADGELFAFNNKESISTIITTDQSGNYKLVENTIQNSAILYTNNSNPFSLFTDILLLNPNTSDGTGYWRITLRNPSAYPTPFKIHLYNVYSGFAIYQIDNQDYLFKTKEDLEDDDIDAKLNAYSICTTNLSLDSDLLLDLNYNSEDGTVLCANQLIEQIRGAGSSIPCTYKNSVANVFIPGALDADHPAELVLEVKIYGKSGVKPEMAVEYSTYEYMI